MGPYLIQFIIYNRFGQIVFKTTDINNGWDGMITDEIQNMDSYVWICTYQFEEQNPVVKKGTVVLVR